MKSLDVRIDNKYKANNIRLGTGKKWYKEQMRLNAQKRIGIVNISLVKIERFFKGLCIATKFNKKLETSHHATCWQFL
ncbi:hypothetical protein Q5O14_05490 [Eubacteriaceae bacterium ES2]|nr:hypothetical protein Q5O14_05490 [Eubacteriaceae bacterium ES2]